MNERNEAFIDLGLNNSYLAVKLYRAPVKPPEILDYEVPIFRRDRIDLANLPWDISFQHLIPYIDGISHVKKIVYEVGMDIDSVKRSLRLLQFHGAIILTDVFKFTNIYKLNAGSAIAQLTNSALMLEMRQFCAIQGRSTPASLPTVQQVVAFLLRLQPGKSIQQILLDSLEPDPVESEASHEAKAESKTDTPVPPAGPTMSLNLENIDIARLLAFAKAHGLIRRVYQYPLYVTSTASTAASTRASRWNQASEGGYPSSGGRTMKGNASTDSLGALGGGRAGPDGGAIRRVSGTRPVPTLLPLPDHLSGEFKASTPEPGQRSGAMPVPGPAMTATAEPTLVTGQAEGHYGTSVGLSGVLSTGTSLNVQAGVGFIKDIGLRRSSFEPEDRDRGREQDRLDASRGATDDATPGATEKLPRPSSGNVVTPTHAATAAAASSPAVHTQRTLTRHFSRSKMTAGQNFLQMNHPPHSTLQQQHSVLPTPAVTTSRYEVRDIQHKLNGRENIDAICCRYDLSYQDIVSYPGVELIYK